MPTVNIQVFISYSHDTPQHEARVLALADRLRADGLDAMIDQYQTAPPEGWQLWMEKQISNASFVLLICTETYLRRVKKEEAQGKGLGVLWESTIIYSALYDAGVVNTTFIPVVFEGGDTQFIPGSLKPTTYYDVSKDAGYQRLYRRLTYQPETPAPSLGTLRVLPPLPRPAPSASPEATNALTPNLVHPYALQANFTGRKQERGELTAWLADDAQPICALVAMGGMGKSALAWYWVKNDVLPASDTKLDGVMWWSFYEGESSFAKFIDDAFKYVSGQPTIDMERFPTTYDRAQELRKLLQTRRVLFVLDGFERQLRAYARLDAAYQQDDATDPTREACSCVDPIAVRLLRDIASVTTHAKVLLTTRLMPSDLEDRAGDALAGVLDRELKELARDDAVQFMKAQGVTKGTSAEIASVCEAYGFHPLSLRLLSGLIARDARTPGDINAAPRHEVYDDLVQRQHHVLEQSYNVLSEEEGSLLSRIAAFRSPMDYDALLIFNTLGSEAKFNDALEDLRVRGLLQRDTQHNRYDLHPVVRHYAYDRLTDKTDVHTRLRDYFAKIPTPDANKVQNIEALMPIIELYHHTVRAGLYDEALDLYDSRLSDSLYYRFGAYQTVAELLLSLFPDGEDYPPRLKQEYDQAWVLGGLGMSYGLSGQPRRSVALFERKMAIREKLGDKVNVAVGLVSISDEYIRSGELIIAEQNLRRSIELSRELKKEFFEATGHQGLGWLLVCYGKFDEAEQEFITGVKLHGDTIGGQWWQGSSWLYRTKSALLRSDVHEAMLSVREALRLKNIEFPGVGKVERDIIRAEWLLGATMVMEGIDLSAADTHLTEALKRCRRINLVETEPDILLTWASLHLARGRIAEAQTQAEEALAIADHCEYRLKQAEIHNFLAQLALDAGNRTGAREHAEIAKERAWCDGPPYCYKPALDEAEEMLRKLDEKK